MFHKDQIQVGFELSIKSLVRILKIYQDRHFWTDQEEQNRLDSSTTKSPVARTHPAQLTN